ncbi:hypothetical protein CR513_35106, partial [Mucuna pruriens]
MTRDHLTLHSKSQIHSWQPSQESMNEPSSLCSLTTGVERKYWISDFVHSFHPEKAVFLFHPFPCAHMLCIEDNASFKCVCVCVCGGGGDDLFGFVISFLFRACSISFSLDGAAKDWLYLQPVLFNT